MTVTRREFLAISGVVGAGLALSSLGLDMGPVKAYAADLKKIDKMKSAKQSTTICAYCAVGCGLICSTDTKDKKIINIEEIPTIPSTRVLVRQGAALFQTTANNPNRLTKILYRAPKSDKWVEKPWDWALKEIAKRVKATRDAYFVEKNDKGQVVNRVEAIAHVGSAALDNEECWPLQAMMRALGLVYIEHQARI
jgi:formate dehydrogenase major subunit